MPLEQGLQEVGCLSVTPHSFVCLTVDGEGSAILTPHSLAHCYIQSVKGMSLIHHFILSSPISNFYTPPHTHSIHKHSDIFGVIM